MADEFEKRIADAVAKLREGRPDFPIEVYETRDFWDEWEVEDMDAAYEEAEQKRDEAACVVSKLVGGRPTLKQRERDGNLRWLPTDEAYVWDLPGLTLLLFWFHEDKELPCTVCVYAHSPNDENHYLKSGDDGERRACNIQLDTTDEEKVAMLDSDETDAATRWSIYQYCRTFPKRVLLEALGRNSHKDYRYQLPEGCIELRPGDMGWETREQIEEELDRIETELDEFGDAHPYDPREFKDIWEITCEDALALLDSDDTSVALRTIAANKVLEHPTEELIAALRRNAHRVYDRRHFDDMEAVIARALDED